MDDAEFRLFAQQLNMRITKHRHHKTHEAFYKLCWRPGYSGGADPVILARASAEVVEAVLMQHYLATEPVIAPAGATRP